MGMLVSPYRHGIAPPSAPDFIAAGTADAITAGSSLAPSFPSVSANDILLLFVTALDSSGNATISTPAGWTAISSFHHALSDTASALFWKRATGSESGTQTVSLSESVDAGVAYAVISSWGPCVTSGDPFERANFYYHGSSTAARGKGLTTTGPNRRLVTFCVHPSVAVTGTNTNGWTEHYDASTMTGSDATVSISSVAQATAGKVLPLWRTLSSAGENLSHTLALIPVGGTPGGADAFANVLFQMQPSGANGSVVFTDESHYYNDTIANGADIQGGKLELDGAADWVHTAAARNPLWRFRNQAYTASDDFTIDLWNVEFDSLAANRTLVSYWNGSGVNQRSWAVQVTTAGNVQFFYSANGSTTTTPINYAAGTTTGVARNYRIVRSTSAGEMYLYINGTKVATATVSAAVDFFGSNSRLVIGALNIDGAAASLMDGRMGPVRITQGALSTGASYTVESLPLATS